MYIVHTTIVGILCALSEWHGRSQHTRNLTLAMRNDERFSVVLCCMFVIKTTHFNIAFWWSSLLPSGSNAQSDNGMPHNVHSIRTHPNPNTQHTHNHSMCAFHATSRHYVTGEWLKGIYLCYSERIEATVYRLPNDISQYNEFQSNGTLNGSKETNYFFNNKLSVLIVVAVRFIYKQT